MRLGGRIRDRGFRFVGMGVSRSKFQSFDSGDLVLQILVHLAAHRAFTSFRRPWHSQLVGQL